MWTIATIPFTIVSDGPRQLLLITLVLLLPPVLRLAQRALVFRRLLHDGVPATDIRRALAWANEGDPIAPLPTGWRHLLAVSRRVSGWLLILSTVVLMGWIELAPWNFSKPAQMVFDAFFRGYITLGKLTVGVFLLDAALRPRPVWQEFRLHTGRGWRALLGRFWTAVRRRTTRPQTAIPWRPAAKSS